MKKRITLFDGTLEKGGAERVISILSKKFAEAGYDVEILLYYDRKIYYEIDERVKITTLQGATGTTKILPNVLWMRGYLKGQKTCLVSFLAPFNIISLVATLGLRLPIIVADRNDPRFVPETYPVRKLRDFLYRFANRVVVQTSHNKAYFHGNVAKKTDVIFNPVDLGDWAGAGLNTPKKKKIVSVGRLMEQKNQKMLIEAFSTVHKKYPEYELYIYGEGPERANLENQIERLNLRKSVHLAGQVDDVFSQIVDAEIFVLSSNYEGMPNALIEAMCLGLPVISTKVSGATDLIKDGECGVLVDCGCKEQMSDAILEMLSDPCFCSSCAQRASEIARILNPEAILEQWISVIGRVHNG